MPATPGATPRPTPPATPPATPRPIPTRPITPRAMGARGMMGPTPRPTPSPTAPCWGTEHNRGMPPDPTWRWNHPHHLLTFCTMVGQPAGLAAGDTSATSSNHRETYMLVLFMFLNVF